VAHAFRREVQIPRRAKTWSGLTEPFEHRTEHGLTFRLHPGEYIDRYIFTDGIYERRFLELVRAHFLGRGSVMLDIGANIGNHALYLSDCFKQVHCFEPNPRVVRMLEENIRLNNLQDKIVVHPVGLSNRSGKLPFFENHNGNLGNSGFVEAASQNTVMLPIVAGDDFVTKLNLADLAFIKVDVENHEPQVFEGLQKTIAKFRPVIAFEYQGQEVGHYKQIAAAMPGYLFVEAHHAPEHASKLTKLRWHLKHQGRPTLSLIEEPESRIYENILALPDKRILEELTKC
jgi:FkbM family methyltransferase